MADIQEMATVMAYLRECYPTFGKSSAATVAAWADHFSETSLSTLQEAARRMAGSEPFPSIAALKDAVREVQEEKRMALPPPSEPFTNLDPVVWETIKAKLRNVLAAEGPTKPKRGSAADTAARKADAVRKLRGA